jgi:hypothetical protein
MDWNAWWKRVQQGFGIEPDASGQAAEGLDDRPARRAAEGPGGESVEDSAEESADEPEGDDTVKVLKKGTAMRVIFFYPGEEGTYVDNAEVTLYENGVVHIQSPQEESTTHLQNCEILWHFLDAEERPTSKVRLIKLKNEPRSGGQPSTPEGNEPEDGGPGGRSGKNTELQ